MQIYFLRDVCERERVGIKTRSHEGPLRQLAIPVKRNIFPPLGSLGRDSFIRLDSLTDTAFGVGLYAGEFSAVRRAGVGSKSFVPQQSGLPTSTIG